MCIRDRGLRHDRNELYGDEWSPRVYGVWQASPAWTVKGGYSHGFKAPNLKQIVPGQRAEGPNTFIGNPDLQPERSDGICLLYTSPSPRDRTRSRMPSSA